LKQLYIIAPYPRGEAPSQRFRFEQYLVNFESADYQVHFHSFLNEKTWKTIYKDGSTSKKLWGFMGSFLRRWRLLFELRKADVVFIHREAAQLGPPLFEWIIAKVLRKNYIYDFDDAIWLPNYSESNARFHRLKAYWKVNYCMKWAGIITAGNEYLANYARKFNQNVTVIPTTIDTNNYHNQTIDYEDERLTIGWTGSHTTMQYLDFLVPIIRDLERKFDFEFRIISNIKPDFEIHSLRFIPWNKETEIQELLKIKIGVMPLVKDQWSSGKCGFKALQYMSLGIPTVLSPVGVNTELIQSHRNGIHANTSEEWLAALTELLTDAALRKRIGKAGQQRVRDVYSVQSQLSTYLKILQNIG
jgi:glycosyltransferase involved in cell wall biosynthesis